MVQLAMNTKSLIRLIFATALSSLILGCSESQEPAKESASPDVVDLVSAGSEDKGQAKGPAITGADAPAPDENAATPVADGQLPPLPIEKTGNVATLPADYPDSWMLVDEASFFSMFGGKMILVDVAEEKPARRIKGLMDKNLLGNFTQSKTRGEFYILESFHARGSRGPRTDVLAIYGKESLALEKEIFWPKANRMTALPERYAMSISRDEKLLYAANFDPAASFNVVNLDTREIVSEIGTPGCVMTFPVGNRSVASICSNGAILTTQLNNDGTLKQQVRGEPFFDTDDTPIFEHAVYTNGIAHFPSFKGLLHSFDMTGEQVKYLGSWDMLSEQDKAGGWRPSGLGLNDYDDSGLIYTIFQPEGREGTQTHGGTQVWVIDPVAKKRVRVIETPNWAISIAVSTGPKPLLVVTNGELNLDVFNAQDGRLIQTVSDIGSTTPLLVHKSL